MLEFGKSLNKVFTPGVDSQKVWRKTLIFWKEHCIIAYHCPRQVWLENMLTWFEYKRNEQATIVVHFGHLSPYKLHLS